MSADVCYMLLAVGAKLLPIENGWSEGSAKTNACSWGCSNKTLFTKTGKGLDLAHLLWALDITEGQKEN